MLVFEPGGCLFTVPSLIVGITAHFPLEVIKDKPAAQTEQDEASDAPV